MTRLARRIGRLEAAIPAPPTPSVWDPVLVFLSVHELSLAYVLIGRMLQDGGGERPHPGRGSGPRGGLLPGAGATASRLGLQR